MTKKTNLRLEPSSFRDPSGFVYYQDKAIFRQVNFSYKNNIDFLFDSGLYDKLVSTNYLLPHSRLRKTHSLSPDAYLTFKTERLPFISYPYEWSFSQLKEAALATLRIQKMALVHGMSLKDASAYNMQFLNNQPLLIDLLSFEVYKPGKPWVAYKQFCQHFLGPLLLMSYTDVRLSQLLKIYIDGIPLDLVSRLLPKKTYLSFAIASHIHLHARNQQRFGDDHQKETKSSQSLSEVALRGIIDNLENTIKGLSYKDWGTEWDEYYTFTNYSTTAFRHKKKLVKEYLKIAKPKMVWDLGANTGEFSRISSQEDIFTVAFDFDTSAVEKNFLDVKKNHEKNLLPLCMDLTNPSSSLGWANSERRSLIQRGPADLTLALALVHHLAISNNIPLSRIAEFCCDISNFLIIEFVPKSDSQVKKLLATREDIFTTYTQTDFENSFSDYFKILKKTSIPHTQRRLYLMRKK